MNPNSKKPGYLFFTPRTPWGTRAGQQSFRQHQRASEDAPEGSIPLPYGMYLKPEVDDKNPEGKTAVNADLGVKLHFGDPKQVVLHGASDEYVNKRNKAFQDSLRKSGIDPTGKILFVKG